MGALVHGADGCIALSQPAPVPAAERIETLDVVRGFALLGILLMNILAFGLPGRAYFDPSVDAATEGIDYAAFLIAEVFADGVMRALFSMLFGAGVVILACGPRAKSAAVYYRRQLLLLAFGLFGSYVLLWSGDILVLYALAGLVLYPLRNWRPRALFASAAIVFAYLAAFYAFLFVVLTVLPDQAEAVQTRIDAGEAVSAEERDAVESWEELRSIYQPGAATLENERLKFQGAYGAAFRANARIVLELYSAYPLFLFWDAFACMLLGMALYKTGTLRGQRDIRFYRRLAVVGFGVGLAVNLSEVAIQTRSGFALRWMADSVATYDLGRVFMALGWAALLAMVCLNGWLGRMRAGLAAAGRMALSNYLLQSVLGLVIFTAAGFGLWNELPRHQLYLVVLAEWAVCIAFSVCWLRRFRFGPLEWLWRTLTYGRLATSKRTVA